MIVKCPNCTSRYRVNDANIPPSGGRIRCPKCEHKFVVFPEQSGPAISHDEGDRTSVASRPALEKILSTMQGSALEALDESAESEEAADATEIVSGGQLPNFAGVFGPGSLDDLEDGTVEMRNPMLGQHAPLASPPQQQEEEEELDGATEVVTGDQLAQMNFPSRRNTGGGPPPLPGQRRRDDPSVSSGPLPTFAEHETGGGQPNSPFSQRNTPPPLEDQGAAAGRDSRTSRPNFPVPQPERQGMGSDNALQGRAGAGPGFPSGGGASQQQQQQRFSPAAGNQGRDAGAESPFAPVPPELQGSAQQAAAAAPSADHDGPWNLKTNFGLTYDFPNTKSLRNWLSNREDLDGYTLSADGENFLPISSFPQLQSSRTMQPPTPGADRSGSRPATPAAAASSERQAAAPAGQQHFQPSPGNGQSRFAAGATQSAAASQSGPVAQVEPTPTIQPPADQQPLPTGPPVAENTYRPPSRDGRWNTLLYILFFVLCLIVVAMALQLAGVVDIETMIRERVEGPAQVAPTAAPTPPGAAASPAGAEVDDPQPQEPPAETAAQAAERREQASLLLSAAEQELEANRLPSALEKLEAAREVDPDRPAIYQKLAEVYEKLGQQDKATEARVTMEQLGGAPPADDTADDEAP